MTVSVFLGLGSNVGNRRHFLQTAIDALAAHPGCRLKAKSKFYETEPLGEKAGGWFLNAAIETETELSLEELFEIIKEIEAQSGRSRPFPFAPRTLDVDILFYGNHIINNVDLVVPHPGLHRRRFVLQPLSDIAPDLKHPVLKKPISQLLAELDDPLQVIPA